MGVVFYLASLVIYYLNDEQENCYLAVFVLFMSALGAGINMSQMPSISKAKQAAS
jgi:hypothetical protein